LLFTKKLKDLMGKFRDLTGLGAVEDVYHVYVMNIKSRADQPRSAGLDLAIGVKKRRTSFPIPLKKQENIRGSFSRMIVTADLGARCLPCLRCGMNIKSRADQPRSAGLDLAIGVKKGVLYFLPNTPENKGTFVGPSHA
jgi:hypothetical protein